MRANTLSKPKVGLLGTVSHILYHRIISNTEVQGAATTAPPSGRTRSGRTAAPKTMMKDHDESCSSDSEDELPVAKAKAAGKSMGCRKVRPDVIIISESDSDYEEEEELAPRRGNKAGTTGRGGGPASRTFAVSRRSAAAKAKANILSNNVNQKGNEDEEEGQEEDKGEEEQEEEEAVISAKCSIGSAALSSKKRSVLDLLAGKLEENLLKRLARDQPDHRNLGLKTTLMTKLQANGAKWRFQLRAGYNLLFYGFGSKRALLERFARDSLTDGAVVSVNGFNPAVTAKQVALAAASVILPFSLRGSSAPVIIDEIRKRSDEAWGHVYIVIHNIDGPGLRSSEEQGFLAELASFPGIHIVASVDHINAPLLWDIKTRSSFRWLCHDATTFAPYFAETLDMPPALMARFQDSTSRRGASTALGSMAPTAQAVFRVMAEAQLDDPASPGLTFPALFRMCRERWLVSSEQALRSFLTEFHDHELVAERMAAVDGGEQREVLYVPLEEAVLRKLLEQIEEQQAAG